MVKMASWFKKHFTCIRREATTLGEQQGGSGGSFRDGDKQVSSNTTNRPPPIHNTLTSSNSTDSSCSSTVDTFIPNSTANTSGRIRNFNNKNNINNTTIVVKNDLKKMNQLVTVPVIKNSNEYRDYSRNCESNFIAAENYCNKLKKNNVRNSNNNNNSIRSNASSQTTKISTKTATNTAVVMNKLQRQQQHQKGPPQEINNNNNHSLETLMRQLRACNECTSQRKICKSSKIT